MKIEHTPGPWSVEFRNGQAIFSGPRIEDRTQWLNFAKVCTHVDNEPDPEGLANARLIAAAPELLAALTWITEYCTEHPEWFGAEDGAEGEWLETARAVIAKATGRT